MKLGAIIVFASLLGCPPGDPDLLYKQASLAFEQARWQQSVDACQRGRRELDRADTAREWRFRALEAAALIRMDAFKPALDLINSPPVGLPPGLIGRLKLLQIKGCARSDCKAQLFQEALDLAREGHDQVLEGEVRLRQGVALPPSLEAESLLRESLQLGVDTTDLTFQARANIELGILYIRLGRFDDAVDSLGVALALSDRVGSPMWKEKSLGNLGWCYRELGDSEHAFQLYERAAQLAEAAGLRPDQSEWLNGIAIVKHVQGDYPEAKRFYGRALEVSSNNEKRAKCLNNLALLAIDTRDFASAASFNDRALDLKRKSDDQQSEPYSLLNKASIAAGEHRSEDAEKLFLRVIADRSVDLDLLVAAQSGVAGLYDATSRPELAAKEYHNALAGIGGASKSLKRDEHKLSFLSRMRDVQNEFTDFLLRREGDGAASDFVESARARILLEKMGLSRQYSRPRPAPNSTILSYWLSPQGCHLWAITSTRTQRYDLKATQAEIDHAVEKYRRSILRLDDVLDSPGSTGEWLYRTLVQPAESLIARNPRVVIIPDGSLARLNFETLVVPGEPPHFWIEDASTTVASSMMLLGRATRSSAPAKLLLLGYPKTPSPDFVTLSGMHREMDLISREFPKEGTTVIDGAAARPSAYLNANAGQYSYIHFAAHGVANNENPLDSAVILSRGDPKGWMLRARDITQCKLTADLVTISACYGSGERTYSGEGLVGLAWAFLLAGAHNVVAALWEVNDSSTPKLMSDMYSGIHAGLEPADALRQAKLNMAHSKKLERKPGYWGPFVLYTGY